jgi:hypothetical protein
MNIEYDLPIAWNLLRTIDHCGWCGKEWGIPVSWDVTLSSTDYVPNSPTLILEAVSSSETSVLLSSRLHGVTFQTIVSLIVNPVTQISSLYFVLAKFFSGILSCLGLLATLFSAGNMAANYGQTRAWKQAKVVSFRIVSRDYTVETEKTLESELR